MLSEDRRSEQALPIAREGFSIVLRRLDELLFVLPIRLAFLGKSARSLDQILRLKEFFARWEVGLAGFLERHVKTGVSGFLARLDREW